MFEDEMKLRKNLLPALSVLALAINTGSAMAAEQNQKTTQTTQADQQKASTAPTDTARLEDSIVYGQKTLQQEAETNYTVSRSSNATKMDLSLKETPQSITVITERQIEEQGLGTIADILDASPGITTNQFGIPGVGAAQYYSRGYQLNNMQIDGMPTTAASIGGIALIAGQDTAIYERVDIIRGSTGLTNGIGDPSGSINFVRKRPTMEPQRKAKISYGSWDRQRTEIDISQPFTQSGNIRGRVVAAYGEGHHWIHRVEDRNKLLYGILEADLFDSTTLTLGGTYFKQDANDVAVHGARSMGWNTFYAKPFEPGRRFNTATDWSYAKQKNWNAFAGLEHRFNDDWKLIANYQYTENTSDRKYGILGADYYAPSQNRISMTYNRLAPESELHNLDLFVLGKYEWFGRDAQLAVGFNGYKGEQYAPGFRTVTNRHNPPYISLDEWNNGNRPIQSQFPFYSENSPFYYPMYGIHAYRQTEERQYGTFISTKFSPIERLSVILGARFNSYKASSGASGRDPLPAPPYIGPYKKGVVSELNKNKIVPYAGIIYDLTPQTSAYLSYTEIFQPHDLTGDGVNDFDGPLPPKEGNTIELGIKTALYNDSLNLHAAVFRMKEKNVAYPYMSAVSGCYPSYVKRCWPLDENGKALVFKNVGSGWGWPVHPGDGPEVRGLELSIAGKLTDKWLINAGYTWLDVEQLNLRTGAQSDAITPDYWFNTPKHAFKLFSSYQLTNKLLVGGSFNFKYKTPYTDPSQGSAENIRLLMKHLSQSSYSVVDLTARYKVSDNMTLGVNAGNVFDRVYKVNNRGSFYGTPRNFAASLTATF